MKNIQNNGVIRGIFRMGKMEKTEQSGKINIQQAKQIQRISVKVELGIYSAMRNLDSNFRC